MNEVRRDTNSPREPPDWYVRSFEPPKSFYTLEDNGNGTVDLVIVGDVHQYDIGDGRREYDCETFRLPGIKKRDGLEDDIRQNFFAWLAHARAYTIDSVAIHAAVDAILDEIRQNAGGADDDA